MGLYVCTQCMYESDRLYNVIRHEQRIHGKRRLRVCCGKKLYTKGDYYAHCARFHPWRRANAVTTIHKYKILGERSLLASRKCCEVTLTHELRRSRGARNAHWYKSNPEPEFQFEGKSSERIRTRLSRRGSNIEVKSAGKEEEKRNDSQCDIEDVPLIKFLSGSERRAYLKKYSPGRVAERGRRPGEKENPEGTTEIAIPPEENTEKAVSRNDEETVEEERRASSNRLVFTALPPKKLLLHRFSVSADQNSAAVLREQNNNDCNQRGAEEKQTEEAAPARNWPKNSKWQRNADKENASEVSSVPVQPVYVKYENGLSRTDVSKMHREFLSFIDFDNYRMF